MSAVSKPAYEQQTDALRHLATAIRLSGESVLVIDIDGTIRDINDAALAFFGHQNLDEILRKNLADLLLPEDRARASANIHKRLAGELIGNLEFEFVLATGEQRWGELNPTILNNVDGQAVGSIIVLRDITTRRHSEAQLRYRIRIEEAVAEVSRIFATTMEPDFQWVLSILGKVIGVNRTCIFRLRDDDRTFDNTQEWCDEHTPRSIARLQGMDSFRIQDVIDRLRRGETFVIPDVNVLPDEARTLKKYTKNLGIRALLGIPLRLVIIYLTHLA